MGGRRPDSPETHPGGGNRLSFRAFSALWSASQRAHRGIPTWNCDGAGTLTLAPERREGLAGRDTMKRLKQMMLAATQVARRARAVPLMVPHGNADSSSDFESAFEILPGDDGARELWRREPVKIPFGRAS